MFEGGGVTRFIHIVNDDTQVVVGKDFYSDRW
jgi:hypothetical protein